MLTFKKSLFKKTLHSKNGLFKNMTLEKGLFKNMTLEKRLFENSDAGKQTIRKCGSAVRCLSSWSGLK